MKCLGTRGGKYEISNKSNELKEFSIFVFMLRRLCHSSLVNEEEESNGKQIRVCVVKGPPDPGDE